MAFEECLNDILKSTNWMWNANEREKRPEFFNNEAKQKMMKWQQQQQQKIKQNENLLHLEMEIAHSYGLDSYSHIQRVRPIILIAFFFYPLFLLFYMYINI